MSTPGIGPSGSPSGISRSSTPSHIVPPSTRMGAPPSLPFTDSSISPLPLLPSAAASSSSATRQDIHFFFQGQDYVARPNASAPDRLEIFDSTGRIPVDLSSFSTVSASGGSASVPTFTIQGSDLKIEKNNKVFLFSPNGNMSFEDQDNDRRIAVDSNNIPPTVTIQQGRGVSAQSTTLYMTPRIVGVRPEDLMSNAKLASKVNQLAVATIVADFKRFNKQVIQNRGDANIRLGEERTVVNYTDQTGRNTKSTTLESKSRSPKIQHAATLAASIVEATGVHPRGRGASRASSSVDLSSSSPSTGLRRRHRAPASSVSGYGPNGTMSASRPRRRGGDSSASGMSASSVPLGRRGMVHNSDDEDSDESFSNPLASRGGFYSQQMRSTQGRSVFEETDGK